MAIARSRLTSQGQISVPASIRRKLGIGPGSLLEWDEKSGAVVVRRAGRYRSEDVHRAIFPEGVSRAKTAEDLKQGIRDYILKRHAGR